MAADLVFPPAAQPDIIRALQKDEVYVRVSAGGDTFQSGVPMPSYLLHLLGIVFGRRCAGSEPRPGAYPAALGCGVNTCTPPRIHYHYRT